MKKTGALPMLTLLLIVVFSTVLLDAERRNDGAVQQRTKTPIVDVTGTWSGSFQSGSTTTSFTMTVTIDRDSQGALVGVASLNSDCYSDSNLEVTVEGKKVVLAGSDQHGNSLTLRGTLDSTGTILRLRYIANGSASGRCESERGSGNLVKR